VSVKGTRGQSGISRRSRRGAIRDLLLYILIGVGVFSALFLVAVFTEVEPEPFIKWLGFAVVTALVFGDTVRANRRQWRNQRFWSLLGVFLAVQSAVGVLLLSAIGKVPPIYWGFFFPLDYGVLTACLAFFMDFRGD
jgi:O-antigen ligase